MQISQAKQMTQDGGMAAKSHSNRHDSSKSGSEHSSERSMNSLLDCEMIVGEAHSYVRR